MVPLLLGIVVAYTLNPLVTWLEAIRIPASAGTDDRDGGVIGALVVGTYSLRGQMQTIVEQLPEAATKFAAGIERMQIGRTGNMQKMQDAATEVEKATTQAVGAAPAAPTSPPLTSSSTSRSSGSAVSCGRARWAPLGAERGRDGRLSRFSSCCSAATRSSGSWCA